MKNFKNQIKAALLLVLCIAFASCGTSRSVGGKALTTRQRKAGIQGNPVKQTSLSPEEQRKYDYFFLEAMRLKGQNDYAGTFDMLQHCLAINPEASSALYQIAQYYILLKQADKAQEVLEKAVLYAPDNYWYSKGLVGLYRQLNKQEEAVALLERMTTRFPSQLETYSTLLDIYNSQEKYNKVISTLNRLEGRIGKNERLTMEKFRIYLQMKDNKKAFHEIESLVKEYPDDMRYQVILGDAYMQNGKKDMAYGLYKKVLDVEPDNAMAMYSLASYYDETGQKELYRQQLDTLLLNKKVPSDTKTTVMRQFILENEQGEDQDSIRVISLFDRILPQNLDDTQIPMLYAQYLISKGMDKESLPVLKKVLDIDPTNTAARMTLLGDAIRKEDYKRVIDLCEPGIESNPDMLEFYFYLAIAYNQAERSDDALSVCQKALKHITPESKKEVVSDFYSILGDIYHTKSLNKEAYAAYDSALVYNPSNIGALNNYAYYLSVERRDLDKAEEMSYKTVKAEPNNSTYLDTYAWILFVKGNYAEARLYIDDAVKNNKEKSGVITEHCGDIYYMTGDVDGALKYWKQALEQGSTSKTLKDKIEQKKYIQE